MVGRRSPQHPSVSRLTLPPETIPSCYRRMRRTEFQPHSGRHLNATSGLVACVPRKSRRCVEISGGFSGVVGPRVIGPSRASALGALLAELQEPAERLRKNVAGLQVYRLVP